MLKRMILTPITVDVRFRFEGYDWLVTDVNGKTFILEHFANKRTIPFHPVHWKLKDGGEGFWHCKSFITKKELRKVSYKIVEKIELYKQKECPF